VGVTPRIARSTFKADEVTAQENDAMSYAAFASAFVLTLCAMIGPISAQGIPEDDPMVASAHLWDLDHNGI